MKKNLLCFSLMVKSCALIPLLFFSMISYAQVSLDWSRTYNPTGTTITASNMVADSLGNTYMVGTTTIHDTAAVVVVKYNSSGDRLWARTYTAEFGAYASDLTIDQAGNVYVIGSVYFFSDLVGFNGYEFMTLKYDASGTLQWAQLYGFITSSLIESKGYRIAVDSEGNVYDAGVSPTRTGGPAISIIKYNKEGVFQWGHQQRASQEPSAVTGIFVDHQGFVYVGGTNQSVKGPQMVLSKYDATGRELWETGFYNPPGNGDVPNAMTLDTSGFPYVTGQLFIEGGKNGYTTAKFGKNGGRVWQNSNDGLGAGDHLSTAIAVDFPGNVYVTGASGTVKYEADGHVLWAKPFSDSAIRNVWPLAMTVDRDGNPYITGVRSISSNKQDLVTLKYDTSGKLQWSILYPGNSSALSVRLDKDNNVYVGANTFNAGIGSMLILKYVQKEQNYGVCCFTGPFGQTAVCGAGVNKNNCQTSGRDAFFIGTVNNCAVIDTAALCARTTVSLALDGHYDDPTASVALTWKIQTSKAVTGFYIQRSIDDMNYKTIGFMPSAGADILHAYSFKDLYPLLQGYYRILYYDDHGYESLPVHINAVKDGLLRIIPNPATDRIDVLFGGTQAAPVVVSIYDLSGRQLLTKHFEAGQSTRIDISELHSGTYILKARQKEKTLVQKIVKN